MYGRLAVIGLGTPSAVSPQLSPSPNASGPTQIAARRPDNCAAAAQPAIRIAASLPYRSEPAPAALRSPITASLRTSCKSLPAPAPAAASLPSPTTAAPARAAAAPASSALTNHCCASLPCPHQPLLLPQPVLLHQQGGVTGADRSLADLCIYYIDLLVFEYYLRIVSCLDGVQGPNLPPPTVCIGCTGIHCGIPAAESSVIGTIV